MTHWVKGLEAGTRLLTRYSATATSQALADCACNQRQVLLQILAASELSFEDITVALELLDHSQGWPSHEAASLKAGVADALQKILTQKTLQPSQCGGAGNRTQILHSLELYSTPTFVKVFRGHGGLVASKLDVLAQFCVHLDLRWPSEHTKAKLVAFYLATILGANAAFDLDPQEKHQVYQDLSSRIKAWCVITTQETPPIWDYPPSLADFQQEHGVVYKRMYEQERPISESFLFMDTVQWANLVGTIPRRGTRKSLKPPATSMSSMIRDLANFLRSSPAPSGSLSHSPRRFPSPQRITWAPLQYQLPPPPFAQQLALQDQPQDSQADVLKLRIDPNSAKDSTS